MGGRLGAARDVAAQFNRMPLARARRAACRNPGAEKNEPRIAAGFVESMAERTGLEPATSGVTGQHSNQLNYRSAP